MKAMFAGVVAMVSLILCLGANHAGEKKDDEKPKYKIGEVMQKAMKGGLYKKVADGKATDEEKKQLVDLFVSMHAHSPKKGEKTAWEKVTISLVEAAKGAAEGDAEKGKSLAKLINCKNCHSEFKGK